MRSPKVSSQVVFEAMEGRLLLSGTDVNGVVPLDSGADPICNYTRVGEGGLKKFTFIDDSGDFVTVRLTGGGWADVNVANNETFDLAQGDIQRIIVDGTTTRSGLSIAVKGKNATSSLGVVMNVLSSLGKIDAPKVDLLGNVGVAGSLLSARFHDNLGSNTFQVDQAAPNNKGLKLRFADVQDLVVQSAMPVASFMATKWVGVSVAPDSITAPSIGKLKILGDFNADLNLGGGASSSTSLLGSVKIGGNVTGGDWVIGGGVGAFNVGGTMDARVMSSASQAGGGNVALETGTSSGIIRVSDYSDGWVNVATPSVAFTAGTTAYGINWQGIPSSAGTYTYKYAYVDKYNKLSPWSNTVTLSNLPAGGGAYFNMTDFVPANNPDIVATCWSVNGDLGQIQFNGVGPYQDKGPFPWCPVRPDTVDCIWAGSVGYTLPTAGTSTILTSTPVTPVMYSFSVPNQDIDFAYCWVTDKGETSSATDLNNLYTISYHSGAYTTSGVGFRTLTGPGVEAPTGAKGYHLYARVHGTGTWYRQPVPECMGTPNASHPDDWLFSPSDLQPKLYNWCDATHGTAIQPSKAATPQSYVSALQLAYDAASAFKTVIVDVPEVQTGCPFIMHYGSGNGYQYVRVVGEDGMTWKLTQNCVPPTGCTDQGTSWPMVIIQNQYGTLEGCYVNTLNSAGYTGSRIGITFADFSGGQAFGDTLKNDIVNVFNNPKSIGLAVLESSTYSLNNHTASELSVDNCRFFADQCIRLEGNQTANVRFNHTFLGSDGNRSAGSCVLYINTTAPVVFEGGTYAGDGSVFAYLGEHASIRIQDIWIDQGYTTYFDCYSYYSASVQLIGGKINAWNDWFGYKKPMLFLNPMGTDRTFLYVDNVSLQSNDNGSNGAFTLNCFDNIYKGLLIQAPRSDDMGRVLKVYSPTATDWQNANTIVYNLGMGHWNGGTWVWDLPADFPLMYTDNIAATTTTVQTQGWVP